MQITINVPYLKWNEFTDKHYDIKCYVHELDVEYRISFKGTENGTRMFIAFCAIGLNTVFTAQGTLEECKSAANKHYYEQAWKQLSSKGNYFIYTGERKAEN